MNAVALVAGREFRERLRDKGFLASNAFLVILILAASVLPSLLSGEDEATRLGTVGPQAAAVAKVANEEAPAYDVLLAVEALPDRAAAERAVRDGEAQAVLLDGGALLVNETEDAPTSLLLLLGGAAETARLGEALSQAGVSAGEQEALLTPQPLSVQPLQAEGDGVELGDPAFLLGLAAVGVLYGLLLLYGNWVAQGVVEEKSSRVVELLLSSVRPVQLLAGKILGLGALGLAQVVLMAVVGGLALALTGGELPPRAIGTLSLVVAWYLLGYFLYATLFAVSGALVSRVEDLQSTTLPLFALLIGAFFAAQAATADPDSTASTVAGLVPFTAPLVQPLLMAASEADPVEVVAAVLLCVATIALLVPLAARAYTGAVLTTRGKVSIRQALRSARN